MKRLINNSLEWNEIEIYLRKNSAKLSIPNCIEARRMIANMTAEVSELSKIEVICRNRHTKVSPDILDKINEDINTVEEFILIGALIG